MKHDIDNKIYNSEKMFKLWQTAVFGRDKHKCIIKIIINDKKLSKGELK